MFWRVVTAFGDSGVMIPTALGIAVLTYLDRNRRLAALWGLVTLLAVAAIFLTKLFFMSACIRLLPLDFRGFSGHATMAALVFPILARLLVRSPATGPEPHAYYSGECLAVMIGVSRLAIHVHSVSEVVAGLALGFMLGRVFLKSARAFTPQHLDFRLFAVPLILLVAVFYMRPAPTEQILKTIAAAVSNHTHALTGMARTCSDTLR